METHSEACRLHLKFGFQTAVLATVAFTVLWMGCVVWLVLAAIGVAPVKTLLVPISFTLITGAVKFLLLVIGRALWKARLAHAASAQEAETVHERVYD